MQVREKENDSEGREIKMAGIGFEGLKRRQEADRFRNARRRMAVWGRSVDKLGKMSPGFTEIK